MKLVPPSVDKFRADLNFFIWTASTESQILKLSWKLFEKSLPDTQDFVVRSAISIIRLSSTFIVCGSLADSQKQQKQPTQPRSRLSKHVT